MMIDPNAKPKLCLSFVIQTRVNQCSFSILIDARFAIQKLSSQVIINFYWHLQNLTTFSFHPTLKASMINEVGFKQNLLTGPKITTLSIR